MVDFIYDFIQLLSGIILRIGFCHHWALFVIEICFGEAITRKDILEEERKFIFNGLSLCRWFNSMCTQWRCFASPVLFWLFESKFYMYANTGVYNHPLFRSFKNTQDNEPSSNTDEVIKIIVASNFITEAARRPAVLIIQKNWICLVRDVMTRIIFCTCCYNCSQCTNHGCKLLQTTFQMCLNLWTHGHSNTVVVFDSNDLSWLSLEVLLWFIGRVSYYYHYTHILPN